MRSLIRLGGIAVAVLLLVAIALPFFVDANTFRPALESQLGSALGRQVRLGDLKLSIFSGAVAANDLSIADDPAWSKSPFLEAKSVKIGVEMLPLIFSRKLNVTRFAVEEPRVAVLQNASGEWNFSTLGSRTAAPKPSGQPIEFSVKLVKIANGRFSVGRSVAKDRPLVLEKVDLELKDLSALSFRADVAGGGEIRLDADTSRAPSTATLKVAKFDLAGSGWTQAVPGMGGIVALNADIQSDGKTAHAKGKIRAEKLKLSQQGTPAARTVEFDFTADHRLADSSGRLSQGDLHIGSAVAHLTGTYGSALHMSLNGDNMAVTELAAILPALGVVLPAGSSLQSGAATVRLAMTGPAGRLVTTGNLGLSKVVLGGFDLGGKMAVLEALAGVRQSPATEIETLAGSIRVAPEGAAAENLQMVVANIGELAGGGTISPSNALDFRMTAKVANRSIPFLVQGTAAAPSFRPDVKQVVADKAKGVAGGLLNRFLGGKRK